MSHKCNNKQGSPLGTREHDKPLVLGIWYTRLSVSRVGGYSRFNFSNACCRYISLSNVLDQLAQLVPGFSSGTPYARPSLYCSIMKGGRVGDVSEVECDQVPAVYRPKGWYVEVPRLADM